MFSSLSRALRGRAFLVAALAFAAAAPASASVPLLMNYQGYLTDNANNPRQGAFKMAFSIYADSTTGSALWTETYASVNVTAGLFNVVLGSAVPLPATVFSGARLWLETAVSDTTLSPRRPLVTVPYSFRAHTADTAYVALSSGGDITGHVQVSCAAGSGGVLVYIPGRSFVAYTAANGSFDLGAVPPGTYTVHVESFSPSQSTDLASVTVTSGGATDVGTVTLGPNLQTDINNCGSCGLVCGSQNGTAACVSGTCQIACNAGFSNCDNNPANGCEVNTTSDVNNCGACGFVCPIVPNASRACSTGTCVSVCDSGYANCDGNPANGCEVNITIDPNNCGSCGHACPAGHACVAGFCQ